MLYTLELLFICRIIVTTVCINFGFASINPITNTNYNKVIRNQNRLDSIYSNEPDDRRDPVANFGNYDFDDYNHGGEELDNSVQYSNENTQSVGSDYDVDEYEEEDESLMSADKRSRHVPRQGKRTGRLVDLCPVSEERYKIKEEWRLLDYKLRFPYMERTCNHTTTHEDYDRQYNRICYSLGRTFEFGHGTHCFQRYISKEIGVESISGEKRIYTEPHFRYDCTCGWATDELGSIRDYHHGKILNLCSILRDKA